MNNLIFNNGNETILRACVLHVLDETGLLCRRLKRRYYHNMPS